MRGRPVLARVAGVIGLLHVGLGLLVGPLGWWMAWRLSPAALEQPEVRGEIERELKEAPEAWRSNAGHLDMAELRHIMTSPSFRVLASGMAVLGVAFNLVLAYLCWRLVRGPLGGLRPFLILMIGFASYVYLLPWGVVNTSPLASTFAAAWGVGNMGLAPVLFTRYWLWGTILVVAGTGASRNP
jgi:hypothetical protein